MQGNMYAVHTVWMALAWIIGSGLVFAIIVFLFEAIYGRERNNAEEILEHRYAAGEIDTAEYERRLSELRKTKPAA